MAKLGFWDILIIVGTALILAWAILKALGFIHSPVWVDMLPYFGAGSAIIGGTYKLGKIMEGIEDTKNNVEKILKIEEKFNKIENGHNLAMQGKLKIHK